MRKPLEGVQQKVLAVLDKGFVQGVLGECYHPARTPGRPPRNPTGQLKALVLQRLFQIPSTEGLVRRLWSSHELRVLCGLRDWEEPWHPSTLDKLRQRLRPEQLERLNQWIIRQLREMGVVDGSILAVDETFIPAYSRRDPKNTRRGLSDPEATLRRHGHRSLFGYGVLLAADAESELSTAAVTVPARDNEKRHAERVVEKARTEKTRLVVADSQFSSRRVRENIRDKGLEPVIPYPRTHRKGEFVLRVDRKFRTHGPPRDRKLYRKRGSVERVFSRLKKHLNLNENHSRGLRRVAVHVQLCILTQLLIALTAVTLGKPELIRSLTWIC